MSLDLRPKENFIQTYKSIVRTALEIIAEYYPNLKYEAQKREAEIKNDPDNFEEATHNLLHSLAFHYKKIALTTDPLRIEGVTRKILIPYELELSDTDKRQGIKDAGKFLVVLAIEELKTKKVSPENIVYIRGLSKIKEWPATHPHPHPHISNEKKPCWGEIRDLISTFLSQARFLETLLCVPNYLSKINLKSCYPAAKADFLLLKEAKVHKKKGKEENNG